MYISVQEIWKSTNLQVTCFRYSVSLKISTRRALFGLYFLLTESVFPYVGIVDLFHIIQLSLKQTSIRKSKNSTFTWVRSGGAENKKNQHKEHWHGPDRVGWRRKSKKTNTQTATKKSKNSTFTWVRSGGADWPTLGYHLFVRTGTTSSAEIVKLFTTLFLIRDDIGGIPK